MRRPARFGSGAYAGNLPRYLLFYLFHDLQLWMPIWVLFLLQEHDFSFTKITLIGVPFWLVATFGQVPAGVVADRWGRVWAMRAGALAFGASMVLLGVSGGLPEVLAAWVLWAVAMTLTSGADSALLHDSLLADGRAHEFEKWAGRAFAVRSTALVAATLAGGPIAGATDLRVPIFLGPVASLAAASIAFTLREPPRSRSLEPVSYRETLTTGARAAWQLPTVRWVIPFVAVILAASLVAEYLLQPFLLSHDVEVGFTFSALQVPVRIMAVVGAVTAFWWARRLGEASALVAVPLALVAGYAGLGLVDHLGAIGFLFLIGLGRAAAMPLAEGYINRRVPSDQRATILSLNHMAFSFLVVPLLPLLGFTVDQVDLRTTFGIAAAVLAGATAVIGTLWLRAHRREGAALRPVAAVIPVRPPVPPRPDTAVLPQPVPGETAIAADSAGQRTGADAG